MLYATLPAGASEATAAAPASVTIGKGGVITPVVELDASPAKKRELTPRCTHPPSGACQYCMPPTDEDFEKKKAQPLNAAGRRVAAVVC